MSVLADSVVLLATCRAHPHGDEDGDEIVEALATQGIEGRWTPWDDESAPWQRYPVILRSTWDYTLRRDEFLFWLADVPHLFNPANVVAWNSNKTYLRDLAAAGVPIVPTTWAEPGADPVIPDVAEFVVKPSVGAGSRGAGRFLRAETEAARAHIESLHRAGRTVMVQPYLGDVDELGETALIYLEGRFSHAIRKDAMLPPGTVHAVQERALFEQERISPREPSEAELDVGARVIAELGRRFGAPLLYTRVDLLPSDDGPQVVEVEVTEPSLFLAHAPGSADVFAVAIAERADRVRS